MAVVFWWKMDGRVPGSLRGGAGISLDAWRGENGFEGVVLMQWG